MAPIITLTTDMGQSDAYVAAMKGVILSINPDARLVDICHTIRPRDIAQAAFILAQSAPYFPAGTVHLAVVDPGVGTERRGIILKTKEAVYVAPDNGILSYVAGNLAEDKLPPGVEAVVLSKAELWRKDISATFHGRDIFAPVAAQISLGRTIADFGEWTDRINVLPRARPEKSASGTITGEILHIDVFGNLITNLRKNDIGGDKNKIIVEVGGRKIPGLQRTYGDAAGLIALLGSSGYLEIAESNGNAAKILGAKVGDRVNIKI